MRNVKIAMEFYRDAVILNMSEWLKQRVKEVKLEGRLSSCEMEFGRIISHFRHSRNSTIPIFIERNDEFYGTRSTALYIEELYTM